MTADRIIPRSAVQIVYVQNKYDGVPLCGHAWYDGRYCYFVGGMDSEGEFEASWALYELEGGVLRDALAKRKLFEDMVGYHCTTLPAGLSVIFSGGQAGDWKAFYKAERFASVTKFEMDVTQLHRLGVFGDAPEFEAA